MVDYLKTLKGHFSIQTIDKNNNIVDEWSETNMIMENARYSMSEIFSNLTNNTFINKIKLGTLGHIGDSIVSPKLAEQGFVKERDRLFCESVSYLLNDTIPILRKNDCFYLSNYQKYYIYLGEDYTNFLLSENAIANTNIFMELSGLPYSYDISFNLPRTNIEEGGTLAENIIETDSGSDSVVRVLQSGTAVTFTFDFSIDAANTQYGTYSVFTEAALYANERIFAMKTFKAKIKDATVLLRIVWTISF